MAQIKCKLCDKWFDIQKFKITSNVCEGCERRKKIREIKNDTDREGLKGNK